MFIQVVTVKAPVPAKWLKLSSTEPIQYLDEWPLKLHKVLLATYGLFTIKAK